MSVALGNVIYTYCRQRYHGTLSYDFFAAKSAFHWYAFLTSYNTAYLKGILTRLNALKCKRVFPIESSQHPNCGPTTNSRRRRNAQHCGTTVATMSCIKGSISSKWILFVQPFTRQLYVLTAGGEQFSTPPSLPSLIHLLTLSFHSTEPHR